MDPLPKPVQQRLDELREFAGDVEQLEAAVEEDTDRDPVPGDDDVAGHLEDSIDALEREMRRMV